ncbi:hypothetical protein GIB67_026133 [Kingdonia uniflora]|uniref:Uncharacterized protein n=1 Tax=Kingdonia uniflora TaxID=39325 RepID=A0A7J7M359_9MAGN|nr:hypothetical protein GIB67_026133 [Kingdonia uniflora]
MLDSRQRKVKDFLLEDEPKTLSRWMIMDKVNHVIPNKRHAFAGALAGTFVSLSLHPVDTIKTLIQSHSMSQTHKPISHIVGSIISGHGVMGLYRGIDSNIVSSAPISAVYTFTYESVKGALLPLLPKEYHSIAHCTASGCASIATSFIFTPSERIKHQMQLVLTTKTAVLISLQLLCGLAGSTAALFITPFDVGADTKIDYVCQEFVVDLALFSTVLNLPPLIGKPHLYPFHDPNSIPDADLRSRMFSSQFSHLVRPHKLCKLMFLLGTGETIDFTLVIWEFMTRAIYIKDWVVGLSFATLIRWICEHHGISIPSHHLQAPIGTNGHARFKSVKLPLNPLFFSTTDDNLPGPALDWFNDFNDYTYEYSFATSSTPAGPVVTEETFQADLDVIDGCDDDALDTLVNFPLIEGGTSLPYMGSSSAELPSSSAPRRHRSSLVRALQFLSTKMDTGLKEVTDLCKDFKKLQASIARERGSEMS